MGALAVGIAWFLVLMVVVGDAWVSLTLSLAITIVFWAASHGNKESRW